VYSLLAVMAKATAPDGLRVGKASLPSYVVADARLDQRDAGLALKFAEDPVSILHADEKTSMSSQEAFRSPFRDVPIDSQLDPASENFSMRAWLSNFVGFTSQDPQRYPRRTAGVSFQDLNVYGVASRTDYQKTVSNVFLEIPAFFRWIAGTGRQRVQILKNFNGLVERGEMLLVLGRPGSGCSTLLKTLSGATHGLTISPVSQLNYQGISALQMHHQFRGEALYAGETDVHFPQLTVAQTLLFAAHARAPRDGTFPGVTRAMYASHMCEVAMASFGLRHARDTRVGSDLVKGASGGERKRVSLAEATLMGSAVQCWDNSTRGLDSMHALEFCRGLRLQSELVGIVACVALYQASQGAYDVSTTKIGRLSGRIPLGNKAALTVCRCLIK
jgi:ATP-binding cassette, subfamily G (WHITE), member 2, PDR